MYYFEYKVEKVIGVGIMALDGIMLAAVKNDLEEKIIGSRINKIYQPEKKLLTINLRQPGENLIILPGLEFILLN